jgi:hypothetical protein
MWQTSTLQPSQGITTQILNCLFGMAILYTQNSFQTYVYCFHQTSVEMVTIQESQAVIKDSVRHTAVLSRAIACFILVQSVPNTYEKVSFDERAILVPVSPFSDKCMALYVESQFPLYPLYRIYRILGTIYRYTGYISLKYTTVDKPTYHSRCGTYSTQFAATKIVTTQYWTVSSIIKKNLYCWTSYDSILPYVMHTREHTETAEGTIPCMAMLRRK